MQEGMKLSINRRKMNMWFIFDTHLLNIFAEKKTEIK